MKIVVRLNCQYRFERNSVFLSLLLLSTCCYLWILRNSRVIADVYRRTKWLSTCYNRDISVTKNVITPCNIDIVVTWYCYLWIYRSTSIVAYVYWSTKARTVIGAYCKEDISVASRSFIFPCNIDIVTYCCYLWLQRLFKNNLLCY